MLGRSHAATGLLAGLATAPTLELTRPAEILLFATTTAGYALLPDLDHPEARASRLLGPLTGLLSRGLRRLSGAVYQATRGPRDERREGTHRHLTHTVVFAAVLGSLVAAGGALVGSWFVLGVLLFGVLLAQDALGDWLLLVAAGLGLWLLTQTDLPAALTHIGAWVGIAVGVGCVAHCLGDALTLSGCPFLWPIRIRGEAWFEIGPPEQLRFRTGGLFEELVILPLTLFGCLLLCPIIGAWLLSNLVSLGV